MATTANPFDDDIDLYKNSRKMMAAMLMRKLSQQNPSLGGNVLNALALGIMGYAEKREEERGAKGLGDVRRALEDAGVTTPSTTTPSTTTPPTKADSAPTSEPGPRTETPSVMAGKYPAAETGTSRPSTAKMTMPDLTPPAMPTEREPVRPMMTAGDAGNFYDRTGALGPTTTPPGAGDMVAPSLDRTLALDPNQMKSQAMAAALLGAPPQNTFAERFAGEQPPGPPRREPMMGTAEAGGFYDATGAANAPPDMLAGVRARAATMGPALSPPSPSRPQATEMDRGPVYPPPPGGEDWGPPNGYRGPGAPLPPAPPTAPAAPTMSPEWQRLQEYQRSQGLPPQPPPPPAMMRPGGAPGAGPPGPQSMTVPQPPAPQGRDLTEFVKRQEGFSSTAKPDYKQWSIGYGTKGYPGQTMSREEAEAPLARDLANARQSVEKFAPNAPAGVKDALTSLTYNAGAGWQQAGLGRLISEGKYDEARDRFLQYNRAGGEKLPGLESRRSAEISNFWNVPGGGAPVAQPSARPAPYQVAQAGGGPPPGPPQAAPQRPGQSVLDQMRKLADTHPDPEVRNRANSIIINQRLQELNPPTIHWAKDEAGKDVPYSQDPRTGQVRRIQVQGEPGPEKRDPRVPERPQGVSQKDWDKEIAQKMAERALGTSLPGEVTGRLSILQVAKQDFAKAKEVLGGEWDRAKVQEYAAHRVGIGAMAGETGRAMRTMKLAVEGALRANTGANAPPDEVSLYMSLFAPAPFDSKADREQKLSMMERFMDNMERNIQQGRTLPGAGGGAAPLVGSSGGTAGGGGWSIRQVR